MNREAPSSPPPELTGRQRRQLRARGHHLVPVLTIGKEGVTTAVLEALDRELEAHELIKLKVLDTAPATVQEATEQAAQGCGAAVAQVLGRTALLFRPRREEDETVGPNGVTPKEGNPAPRR